MIQASDTSNGQEPTERYLSLGGDFLDSQLVTADDVEIGRVAGIQCEWHDDGHLFVTALLTGPQTLAGRVARPLRALLRWMLHDRFEHAIPVEELAKIELTLSLRGNAVDYQTGSADRWIASHILRWIPGSGYKKGEGVQGPGPQLDKPVKHSKNAHSLLAQELIGRRIVTHDGKRVGHIFDLQVSQGPKYEIVALVYGRLAPLYRMHVLYPFTHMLHLREQPETIYWNEVASLEHTTVTLKPNSHEE